jgi:thiamine biosynthesis lipoprotein
VTVARETRLLMGMPITVEIVDGVSAGVLAEVFNCFAAVDERFSLYKEGSEISALNKGRSSYREISREMREVLELAEQTKRESNGFFEIRRPIGGLDPSGIVKGWAIRNAADLVRQSGAENFYVEAGGDIQCCGKNRVGEAWTIGIQNPFNAEEFIKRVTPEGRGVATSGTSSRGQHIYNPHRPSQPIDDIVSLTVIGPDVLEADRFATAGFAMGKAGIFFIEQLDDLEGYIVETNGRATWTSGFGAFVRQ